MRPDLGGRPEYISTLQAVLLQPLRGFQPRVLHVPMRLRGVYCPRCCPCCALGDGLTLPDERLVEQGTSREPRRARTARRASE